VGSTKFSAQVGLCILACLGKNRNLYMVEMMNCTDTKQSFTVKQFLPTETQKVASVYCTEDSSTDTLHQDGEMAEGTDRTGSWFVAIFSTKTLNVSTR